MLLVFGKDDAQSDALKWAAERLSCECKIAYSPETATDSFQNFHPHIVFIDSRQSKFFDAAALCKYVYDSYIYSARYGSSILITETNEGKGNNLSIILW